MKLNYQNHMGFYVDAKEPVDTDEVLDMFTKQTGDKFEEYENLIKEELAIVQRRTKLLTRLKSDFRDFVKTEMPEMLL